MTGDLALQLELAVRILAAAALGAVIGVEREMREQQAGLRTHLLVALGAALFTVISIYGFSDQEGGVDNSRVAAGVVTGIGFLGAGAILRQGLLVRGLTTAGSLWGAAAVGMAAGVGEFFLAVVGTGIIVVSLWPLRAVSRALRGARGRQVVELQVELDSFAAFGGAVTSLTQQGATISRTDTVDLDHGRCEATILVHLPRGRTIETLVSALSQVDGVAGIKFGD